MPVKFRSEGGTEARERLLGRKWLVQMLSELTYPPSSKACSEQTRPGLNVKNKLLFQYLLFVAQKHIYCLLGTQKYL